MAPNKIAVDGAGNRQTFMAFVRDASWQT